MVPRPPVRANYGSRLTAEPDNSQLACSRGRRWISSSARRVSSSIETLATVTPSLNSGRPTPDAATHSGRKDWASDITQHRCGSPSHSVAGRPCAVPDSIRYSSPGLKPRPSGATSRVPLRGGRMPPPRRGTPLTKSIPPGDPSEHEVRAADAIIRAVASRMKDCLPGARDDPRRSVSRVEVLGRPTVAPTDDNRRVGHESECVLSLATCGERNRGPSGEGAP